MRVRTLSIGAAVTAAVLLVAAGGASAAATAPPGVGVFILSAIESARSPGRCRGSVAANRAGGEGVARLAAVRLSDLDGAALGVRAAAKARAGADPAQLPPGRYEVVLEPNAVGDLLLHLASWNITGNASG